MKSKVFEYKQRELHQTIANFQNHIMKFAAEFDFVSCPLKLQF